MLEIEHPSDIKPKAANLCIYFCKTHMYLTFYCNNTKELSHLERMYKLFLNTLLDFVMEANHFEQEYILYLA